MEPVLLEAAVVACLCLTLGTWVAGRWGLPGLVGYVLLLGLLWLLQQRR